MRACAVEMHVDMSQEQCGAEISKENAAPSALEHRFVRACTVEMHMDIVQEPYETDTTSIEQYLIVTIRTPSLCYTAWGTIWERTFSSDFRLATVFSS